MTDEPRLARHEAHFGDEAERRGIRGTRVSAGDSDIRAGVRAASGVAIRAMLVHELHQDA